MKTKLLLSTMALAALMSGCSNDEWNENAANVSGLENRRVAGKVEFSIADGTSTRMEETESGAIIFSADDKISAALMDEFKGQYPVTNFVNYMQTNYPFVQESNSWVSEGVLLEGNYFFSYPFNACVQNRGALTNTVPVDQYAYDRTTGEVSTMQAYVDNQFYLGYSYIAADGNCVDCNGVPTLKSNVKLEKVHAYPVFRFVNQTGAPEDKPLKVYKISLRKKDASMFYNTVAVFPKTKKFNAEEAVDEETGKYDLWETAVFNANMPGNDINTVNVLPFDCSTVNSTTLEYNLHFPEGGYEIENWTSFEACMVVPAGIYGEMEVVLYTNEGVGTYPVFMPATGEDYQVQSGMYKLSPYRKSLTTIRFDITSLSTNQTDFTVQSTENLIEYLKYIEPVGNSVKLNITTVGTKVELNQEVYDILKNKNLKINLNGTIVIPAGVPADAIDRINFYAAGSSVINNGTQVVTEMPAVDRGSSEASNVTIVNNGELTLKANMPNSWIMNNATLTVVDSDVFRLYNGENARATVTEELTAIDLFNGGQLTINKDATVNVLHSFSNAGMVTNNGTLNIWPMKVSGYEFGFIKTLPIDFWTKYQYIYNALVVADAQASNAGVIDNNGVIDSNGLISDKTTIDVYTDFWPTLIFEQQTQVGAVSSLINMGSGVINNNANGRMTNLSNFALLVPDKTSYTSLVLLEELPYVYIELYDVFKAYLQADFISNGDYTKYGFIDMSKNDGVDVDMQAVIRDNITKEDIDPFAGHNQIIYVKRTGKVNIAINTPKYINTLWLENVSGNADGDISKYTLWLDGNNSILVKSGKTLKLGFTAIEGTTRFYGEGETVLTNDVVVAKGSTLTIDNTWSATQPVEIFAQGAKVNEGGKIGDNITIDYTTLADYVGPWVIIR